MRALSIDRGAEDTAGSMGKRWCRRAALQRSERGRLGRANVAALFQPRDSQASLSGLK